MTRRSSAWLVAFEYSDPHMTACQVMRNRRSHNPGTDDYDVLITALPLPELLRILRPVPGHLIDAARGLHNSHGLVVGVGLDKPCETSKCWTYFPEASAPFYRVTFLSNYSPKIAPEGHTLLLTETSYSEHKPEDRATIVDRVVDGLVATRLIAGSVMPVRCAAAPSSAGAGILLQSTSSRFFWFMASSSS